MWIQLLTRKSVYIAGTLVNYHPGDWVDVGKTMALAWLADGSARSRMSLEGLSPFDAGTGVYVRGDEGKAKDYLAMFGKTAKFATEPPILQWPKTLVWTPSKDPLVEAFPTAWELLDRWEALIPLFDYGTLALTLGSEADRVATKAVIRDLRVPVYDHRMMFLRRCPATEDLLSSWEDFSKDIQDRRLALMCALYTVKPLVMALPKSWYSRRTHQTNGY